MRRKKRAAPHSSKSGDPGSGIVPVNCVTSPLLADGDGTPPLRNVLPMAGLFVSTSKIYPDELVVPLADDTEIFISRFPCVGS